MAHTHTHKDTVFAGAPAVILCWLCAQEKYLHDCTLKTITQNKYQMVIAISRVCYNDVRCSEKKITEVHREILLSSMKYARSGHP